MSTNRTGNRFTPQVWPVIEKAYANAAAAFARMLNTDTTPKTLFAGVRALPVTDVASFVFLPEESGAYMVTTELLGGLSGKSYLLLSRTDIEILADLTGLRDVGVMEAFLKELDNILSAAVITVLSNELNVNIYGDVPLLFHDIHQTIHEDFASYSGLFFVSAMTPEVRAGALRPTFVWVIDLNSLNQVTDLQPALNAL